MQTASRQRISPALTVAEFAAMNNVSQSLVRRGIADGSIPSFKVGGARRIPARFLDELQRCGR
jgi:excisionase family DNA binding protein